MLVDPAGAGWHGCAVLSSAEQGWEALADFVEQGLGQHRRVVVSGLRLDQQAQLLRRLAEDGLDTEAPLLDGRVILMPEESSRELVTLDLKDLTRSVADQVGRALADGHQGVRLGGIFPGAGIGPYESVLDELVRAAPLDVLCGYDRTSLTFDEAQTVRVMHAGEMADDAEYDDGLLRITRPRPGWLRLAGRWERQNHAAALAVVTDAAAAGHRNVDTSSLRFVDPVGLHAMLTGIGGGLRLQRPNHLVQRLAGLLANKAIGPAPADDFHDEQALTGAGECPVVDPLRRRSDEARWLRSSPGSRNAGLMLT